MVPTAEKVTAPVRSAIVAFGEFGSEIPHQCPKIGLRAGDEQVEMVRHQHQSVCSAAMNEAGLVKDLKKELPDPCEIKGIRLPIIDLIGDVVRKAI